MERADLAGQTPKAEDCAFTDQSWGQMHGEDAVIVNEIGHIAVIQLNCPQNRNSMTPQLLDGFAAAVARVREMPHIRCVVVTGSGENFSAGADFRSQIQRDEPGLFRTSAERSYAMYTPFLSLLDLEVPVIGALNGHAIGGGFGLALVTDLRLASATAKYGATFARLGLHSGMAISYLLPRLVGVQRAAELLFTGRVFHGDEGERMGLFLQALPSDQVLPAAMALAERIAANAPIAVRLMKKSFYEMQGWDPRAAAWREAFAQATTVDTEDAKEGMAALLAKRQPEFGGS